MSAPEEKENFLDRNALFSVLFLIAAFVAWDFYMKKKYPHLRNPKAKPPVSAAPADSPPSSVSHQPLSQPQQEGRPANAAPLATPFPQTEEELFFISNEKADWTISSHGLAVKKAVLKNFTDREGRPVVFEAAAGEAPLFATELLDTGRPLPFQAEQNGNLITGRFQNGNTEIVQTLQPEGFILNSKIEIKSQGEGFSGLALRFHKSQKGGGGKDGLLPWLSRLIFFSLNLQDKISAYASSAQGAHHLPGTAQAESYAYQEVFAAALGPKYFGAAFVNRSSLLPEVRLRGSERRFRAEVRWKALDQNPFTLEYQAFLGPKSLKNLSKAGPHAERWIDFGFFSWMARPIFNLLKLFHHWSGNWGVAVILLTFVIRLCLLPINIRSYKSMKAMQKIQPELQALREKYKKDPQKQQQETMALMKERKVNPVSGCLPMFLQLPVFFALYRVLQESAELYQAPFALWIQDLSFKDPYYVLPALAGAVMFVQQKITPASLPPAQARIMNIVPLVFSVFLLGLPSGLNLYILVSYLFGLAQQWFFMRSADSRPPPPPAKAQ